MPFLDQFRIEALPKKWADEGKLWQERYFPEMPEVFDAPNWSRHYPETPMPRLSVIMAKPDGFAGFAQKVVGATAATGNLTNRLWTADKMPDAQFMTALKIIRAQASTGPASSNSRCSTTSSTGRWRSRCAGCGSWRSRTTSPPGRPS